MAYGSETGVTLLIGGADLITFTAGSSGNIVAAIVMSDTIVDRINSSAAATNKTLASNLIAAEILKRGRVTYKLKGLNSDGGNEGRPGVSGSLNDLVTSEVYLLLKTQPSSKFHVSTPDVTGSY